MEYGRLSGKLYSDEDWVGMSSEARELLISAWSWAIDYEREEGEITEPVLHSLSGMLGHGTSASNTQPAKVIESLTIWGWLEDLGEGDFRLLRWEHQADLIRAARTRRAKERERYERRKGGGSGA